MKRLYVTAILAVLVLISAAAIAVVTPYEGTPMQFTAITGGYDPEVGAAGMVGMRRTNQYLAIRLKAEVKDGTVFAVTSNRNGRDELIGMITVNMQGGTLLLQSRDGQSPLFPLREGLAIQIWSADREMVLGGRIPAVQ